MFCLMIQSTVAPSAAGYGKVIETRVYDSTIHIHVNCMDTFHRLRHRVVRQAYFFAHTAEKNA